MKYKTECIELLRKRGFTEDFTAAPRFSVHSKPNKTYKPHELKISGFYHCMEAENQPDDSVVYAIETNDGRKGILIDNNREYLDDRVSEFIHVVNIARQRSKRPWYMGPVEWVFIKPFFSN